MEIHTLDQTQAAPDQTQAASTTKEVEPVTVHVESASTPEALAWSLDNATDDFTAPTRHSWRRSIVIAVLVIVLAVIGTWFAYGFTKGFIGTDTQPSDSRPAAANAAPEAMPPVPSFDSTPATREDTDTAFIARLSNRGITFSTNAGAIEAGKTVCQMLSNGDDRVTVRQELMNANPGFKPSGAEIFMQTATEMYCG